ncbi:MULTISPECIES: glycosyltransferase family 4 protein [Pseudomonas]|jgi:glycosyltransferase involved in cell wall biosynthesis|uniref:Glycosyltransferase family 4 protein n=1 Tax=Pseudomonas rhodesiae TaxID=76760 RepID=A0A8I1JHK6_9PSED|nr:MULTISPECIES: glycosyltransferase family 4 protein [Pseudomonas]MBI6605755.1 glycosyltransferase family 4 protein [Pseudomonas sp. S4_EA_1b]MBI6627964.1 glycosyltransferase family 4 protein [Pseudomonas rhodesiae]NMY80850.1 glycosyltransferase family 4 protein [Pseudomonas rhodesiae]NMZ15984.1 glycosyltransferase family 4 protein [Pseudomonas rhodesiae]
MKFLLIASYADSLINFRGPLVDALRAQGQEVHVAAPDMPPGSAVRVHLEQKGVVVHEIPLRRVGMNPFADLLTLVALCKLMRDIKLDSVLAYTVKPVIYGLLAARIMKVKRRFALITGLGYAFQSAGSQAGGARAMLKALVQRLYALALSSATRVFFQNPDDEALFKQLRLVSVDTPSTVVNGSGVDVNDFKVAPFPEHLSFLLIGRLLGDKGVREFVSAARAVKSKHAHVIFKIAGWIDENPNAIAREELEAWIVEGTVEYLGRLKDVRPAIANSSVYVLPSYREGTPRTVLEAMAMGRAVITTDAPGCRETVIDGVNGFLVPVQKVDELTTAMLSFAENPHLVSMLGNKSRELAELKYDVKKVNAAMLQGMGI